jgi:hypothetical protein
MLKQELKCVRRAEAMVNGRTDRHTSAAIFEDQNWPDVFALRHLPDGFKIQNPSHE